MLTLNDASFNRVVVAAMALGFLLLIIAGGTAGLFILRSQDHARWVNHTYEVERAVSQFRVLSERAEAARRGFLLSGDIDAAETFRRSAAGVQPALSAIGALTADNPRQQTALGRAEALSRDYLRIARSSMARARAGDRSGAAALFRTDGSIAAMQRLRSIAAVLAAEEERLLSIRNARQQESLRRFFAALVVTGLLLAAVAIGSVWLILRYTRDLAASRGALRALNENLEAAVEERTADLSRANAEIQRFAYIVSHDLRSPLVNVMGFTAELDGATRPLTELVDRVRAEAPHLLSEEAALAVGEDLPEAVRFIRSSTQKMDRLINAILRLSREGRRVITPEPVDVASVAEGIGATLQHRLTEQGGVVQIERPLPPLVSDRLAIEQILSNLIENAVKYAAPDRPVRVTVRGHREGGKVIVEVADNGRGIDPRDHDRVFDLFRRSGTQDQPGEGIGLAHVRALVYRLGGVIDCRSALGEGSAFRITMPAAYAGEQGAAT